MVQQVEDHRLNWGIGGGMCRWGEEGIGACGGRRNVCSSCVRSGSVKGIMVFSWHLVVCLPFRRRHL